MFASIYLSIHDDNPTQEENLQFECDTEGTQNEHTDQVCAVHTYTLAVQFRTLGKRASEKKV